MSFAKMFQGTKILDQEPCPVCHGVGFTDKTHRIDMATNSANVCDLCMGTGTYHNTYTPDPAHIKNQMFLAEYFHAMDPAHIEA